MPGGDQSNLWVGESSHGRRGALAGFVILAALCPLAATFLPRSLPAVALLAALCSLPAVLSAPRRFWLTLRAWPVVWMLCLLGWAACSLVYGISAEGSAALVAELFAILLGAVVLGAAASTLTERSLRVLPWALLGGIAITFLAIAVFAASGGDVERTNRGAIQIALFTPAAVAGFWAVRRRVPAVSTALGTLVCLAFLESTAGVIAGVLGLGGLVLISLSRFALIALSVLAFSGLASLPLWFAGFVSALRQFGPWPRTMAMRLDYWADAARRAGEHVWTGHGMDASRALRAGDGTALFALHPHNMPVQAVMELGLVGLWLFATGLGLAPLAAAGRATARLERGAYAALWLAAAMPCLVSFGLWQIQWWVQAGTACAVMAATLHLIRTGERSSNLTQGEDARVRGHQRALTTP